MTLGLVFRERPQMSSDFPFGIRLLQLPLVFRDLGGNSKV